jgi:hypothetical protein
MRLLAALALAAAAVPVTGAAATTTPTTGPDGVKCGLGPVPNPTAEANTQTGVLSGGPVFISDPDTGLASGTLTCTVQVGNNTVHWGADAPGGKASVSGTGIGVLPSSVISYTAAPVDDVHLCTQFTYTGGPTFYWDGTRRVWTSDANAPCRRAVRVAATTDAVDAALDGLVCPVLTTVPVVANTLRNVWGCDRGMPGELDGPLVVPDM